MVMGEIVIKAAHGEDLYLIWSTTSDSPAYIGTWGETRELLWDMYRAEHPHSDPHDGYSPDDAMRRADDWGSSWRSGSTWAYGWTDAAWPVQGEGGDWYTLSRTNLVAYARALLADDKAAAQALLVAQDTF